MYKENKMSKEASSTKTVFLKILLALVLVIVIIVGIPALIISLTEKPSNQDIPNDQVEQAQPIARYEYPKCQIEYYTETVPYQEEIELKYNYQDAGSEDCSDFGNYKKCYYVNIINNDNGIIIEPDG